MATATTTRNLDKTGFVKEILNDRPQANTRAVNEAWTAAGFEGTISHTLVSKVRSQLGLTGNVPQGPGRKAAAETGTISAPAVKKRGRPKRAARRGGNQGKTAFVIEHLRHDPEASDEAINQAWAAAGNEGGISGSLLYKIRAKEGLTGKKRAKGRGARKKGWSKSSPKRTTVEQTPEPVAETPKPLDGRTHRGRSIAELEADIDRLIFKLMGVGGMETIEDELRKVRRFVYRSYQM
jgi:hypothetical protein